jgi:hypothetical protein
MQIYRLTFIIVLSLFLTVSGNAQKKTLLQIIDAETKAPVSKASIIVVNQGGKAADDQGFCNITIRQFPAVLEISSVGYQKKFIQLPEKPDSLMQIPLLRETINLDVFTITAEKIEKVYADDFMSVLDFDFYEGKMVILAFKNRYKKSFIILRNIYGEIISEKQCPISPRELYRDCFGNLHVIGSKEVCQINIEGKDISFYGTESIDEFNEKLRPWDVYLNNKLYYREVSSDLFVMKVGYFDERTKKRNVIAILRNENSLSNKYDYREQKYTSIAPRSLTSDSHQFQKHYDEAIHFDKIEASYFLKDSMVYVLDFTHKELTRYNQFDLVDKRFYMNFNEETGTTFLKNMIKAFVTGKGWTFESRIYQDIVTEDIYLLCKKNGRIGVYFLDTDSGKLYSILTLHHSYPEKLKIHDGFVYYKYRGEGTNKRMKVYRQNLRD